jgi:hypothetical protein
MIARINWVYSTYFDLIAILNILLFDHVLFHSRSPIVLIYTIKSRETVLDDKAENHDRIAYQGANGEPTTAPWLRLCSNHPLVEWTEQDDKDNYAIG